MTTSFAAGLCLLSLASSAIQDEALAVETAERTRQAIEFRSNTTPGNLDPATGSLTVEYGVRRFTEEEALAVLDSPAGTRFMLSAGFPATYDIDVPVAFGKARLEPGLHFVRLERLEGGWQLAFVALEAALAAGWTGGEEIPGTSTVIAVQATERRDGSGKPGHRLWTGPGENDRGLAFRVQYGRLSLIAVLEGKGKKGQPAAWESKRSRSSLRFGQDGPLLASLEHGFLEWDEQSASALERLKSGKRWPLARDHWTNLVVLAPIELGSVAVAPGEYVLLLERAKGDDAWMLALIDSASRRKAFTNAHHAEKLGAVARIPLAREEPAISADDLDARFVAKPPARLEFHCGPNRWIASVARGR